MSYLARGPVSTGIDSKAIDVGRRHAMHAELSNPERTGRMSAATNVEEAAA